MRIKKAVAMIAGKRVPAAYRKQNRVSHLTADAVRQMGYIVEDSGKKLTVGQGRRQRGGAKKGKRGERDTQPAETPSRHWATNIHPTRRDPFVAKYLPGERMRRNQDGLDQMDRAADAGLRQMYAQMGQSPRQISARDRAQFFIDEEAKRAETTNSRRLSQSKQESIMLNASHMDGVPVTPPPGDAKSRRQAFLAESAEPKDGEIFANPGSAEEFVQSLYRQMDPELFSQPMALYRYLQDEIGRRLPRTDDQIAALRLVAQDLRNQGNDIEERQAFNAIVADIPTLIERIEAKSRTQTHPSVHTQHVDDRPSATPASTLHHAQDDHDTSSASVQWTITDLDQSSVARQLDLSGISEQAAAVARARDSAGDPETLAAIGRLSTAAENARTDVDYRQIPAVAAQLDSDPQLADLVRRGLVNPRRLSDPLYAQRLKQQLNRRESDVRGTDGQRRYSTSTSQPQMLQRGRIARSKVPVFERIGDIPSRATPGLKYYRRAMATRAPIFAAV